MGQSIKSRPADERARHYRELAEEAMRMAEAVKDETLRSGYMAMAAGWHSMAQEAERLVTLPPSPPVSCDEAPNGNR